MNIEHFKYIEEVIYPIPFRLNKKYLK